MVDNHDNDPEDELFGPHGELHTNEIDAELLCKMITHALNLMIVNRNGDAIATFTRSNDFIFLEVEDHRFTIQVKDRNKYQ